MTEMIQQLSESALIEKYRSHEFDERTILGEMLRRFAYLIRFLANKYLGKEDADDFVIDLFSEMPQIIDHYRDGGDFKSYLYSVTRNRLIAYARETKKETISFEQLSTTSSYTAEELGESSETSASGINDSFWIAIRSVLNEEELTVLELFYVQRLGYAQIANLIKVEHEYIRKIMVTARRKLRDAISSGKISKELLHG